MNLIIETTTGRLVPGGTVPHLARGPVAATLQFVTNGAAALLPGGAPIAYKLSRIEDPATAVATFNVWTADPVNLRYTATLDVLGSGLAWLSDPTLYGRIDYGSPTVNSALHHVAFVGAASGGAATPPTTIIISQPSGPTNYVQEIGSFGGRVATNQTEGFWRVKAPCQLLGLQLNAQDAPTGANILVDVMKGGVAQTKVATLTAGQKSEETIFGSPLALAIGDVVQFRATQVGSTKPGTNLEVKGILQLL